MNIENILAPYGAVPTEIQYEWLNRKTAFIHLTVNTFTGKEWGDGTESPSIFNPEKLDARKWIYTLKEAGFTTAILTAKHHDGFCLWPSKYTEHSIKNSPYKNGKGDIVREFTNACKEFGLQAGIYLSPWDRNHPQWATPVYDEYYMNQLTELLTGYGEIYEIWWDGAGSDKANYKWEEWAKIVRKYQPKCAIFGPTQTAHLNDIRWVGNERGEAAKDCFATLDIEVLKSEDRNEMVKGLNAGTLNGKKFIPAEADVSIRPGWFYHPEQDEMVKTPEDLVDYWFTSAGKNSGILLNVPPTPEGLFHEIDCKNLLIWNEYIKDIFKTNLAENAEISGNSISAEYSSENLLNENDTYFVSDDKSAEITFNFKVPITFNCFKMGEEIRLGQRVREFAVEYFENGEFKPIIAGQSIGFCRAEYFDDVTTTAVRLKIKKAEMNPILKCFGLYVMNKNYFPKPKPEYYQKELTKLPTAKITKVEDGFEVDFGGIYTFSRFVFVSDGVPKYEIFAFDGQEYQSIYKGENPSTVEVCFFKPVDYAYKVKLALYDCEIGDDRSISVMYE